MSEETKEKDDLAEVNNLEIEPLSDEDLDSVAGGDLAPVAGDCTNCTDNRICTS